MADEGSAKARVETAVKRLEAAIGDVLELKGAFAAEAGSLPKALNSLNSDLTKSQADNDRLSEQLRRAKTDCDSLQSAMEKISTRLDNAIDAVQSLLEKQPGT